MSEAPMKNRKKSSSGPKKQTAGNDALETAKVVTTDSPEEIASNAIEAEETETGAVVADTTYDAGKADEADEAEKVDKKPKKASRAKLTMEKLIDLKSDYEKRDEPLSQREILRHLGGSFGTASSLLRKLQLMGKTPLSLEVVVSEATKQAIADDITRHLEQLSDNLNSKIKQIEDAEEDMRLLTDMFESLLKDISQ